MTLLNPRGRVPPRNSDLCVAVLDATGLLRVAVQEVVGDESDACANSTERVVWDQSQAGLQQTDESKQAVSRVASLCKSGHTENIDWISNHDG